MSYFLCGKFMFGTVLSFDDVKALAFKVVDEGLKNGLSLQLGPCIVQPIVFEIIGENISSDLEGKMPYLVTGSPISDCSDELIDFNALNGGIDRLGRTLNKVQAFMAEIKKTAVISEAVIYFSEGYDDAYKDVSSSLETLTDDCIEIFDESGETVSLRVSINLS